jgi:hypothetical protein
LFPEVLKKIIQANVRKQKKKGYFDFEDKNLIESVLKQKTKGKKQENAA